MKTFTFKKISRSKGLAGVAEAGKEYYDIKLDGVEVGIFGRNNSFNAINIRFKIVKKDIMEDGNPNCIWKWITLKYKPISIEEAKRFLKAFNKEIQIEYKLYINKD